MTHLPPIVCTVVPQKDQRYDTVGDWYEKDGVQHFVISKMRDPRSELAVLMHEIGEEAWCRLNGVTQQQVDEWDFGHAEHDDPGSLPGCPYGKGHQFGDALERIAVDFLGLSWDEHCYNVDNPD